MTDIEKIINSQDYFDCAKLACRLPKGDCIKRQEQALSFEDYVAGRKDTDKKIAYAMCADCSQGREIKEAMRMAQRKCDGCGRLLHSGRLCSACKRKKEAALAPIIRSEAVLITEEVSDLCAPLTIDVEGSIKTDPESGAQRTTGSPEKHPKVEGKKMFRSTCSNCDRPNLLIVNAAGMCHSCHGSSRGLAGEERRIALAAAKKRLTDPNYKRTAKFNASRIPTLNTPEGTLRAQLENVEPCPISKPEASPEPISASLSAPEGTTPTPPDRGVPIIQVPIITEADRSAYDFLQSLSNQNRRTIPQQILWMIECNRSASQECGGL